MGPLNVFSNINIKTAPFQNYISRLSWEISLIRAAWTPRQIFVTHEITWELSNFTNSPNVNLKMASNKCCTAGTFKEKVLKHYFCKTTKCISEWYVWRNSWKKHNSYIPSHSSLSLTLLPWETNYDGFSYRNKVLWKEFILKYEEITRVYVPIVQAVIAGQTSKPFATYNKKIRRVWLLYFCSIFHICKFTATLCVFWE